MWRQFRWHTKGARLCPKPIRFPRWRRPASLGFRVGAASFGSLPSRRETLVRRCVGLEASVWLLWLARCKFIRLFRAGAHQVPVDGKNGSIQVENLVFEGPHTPILIDPNPLNPLRYVVRNNGFTRRESAYLNNAGQLPMLPDWPRVVISRGSTSQLPGETEAAGLFDEQWQWTKEL